MTRLSCHRFRANEVRLWLSVIAYNLGNLWRRLAVPKQIDTWSLTSLQQRVIKTGGRLVKHARAPSLLPAVRPMPEVSVVSEKSLRVRPCRVLRVQGGHERAFEGQRKGPPDETSELDFTKGRNLGIKTEMRAYLTILHCVANEIYLELLG